MDVNIRNRKELEKEQLRNKIQKAAVKIIIEEGFDKLSMRKIASDIDYTATTIYSYFENKDAIIQSIANDTYLAVVKNILIVFEENKRRDFYSRLELIIRTFINTMIHEPETIRAVLQSSYNMFEENEEDADQELLNRFLEECANEGVITYYNANTKLLLIVSILGFISFIANARIDNSKERDLLIDDFVRVTMSGMCGRNENK